MAVAATLSCVLVSSLLLAVGLPARLNWRRKSPDAFATFARKQVAVFVICLLCSDLIQSISGIIQVKWAAERRLVEGTTCAIQAATLVMGDLGSAVWSCVIAIHTFSALALQRQWSRKVIVSTVVTGWTLVISLTAFGPLVLTNKSNGSFFAIAGTWCFISSEYSVARLGVHYIPLLISAGVIVILYGLVCFVLLGTISFTGSGLSLPLSDAMFRRRLVIAKRMLWYPAAYLTCILPITVMRFITLKGDDLPQLVWIFGMFLLLSLGAADAVIYAITRHMIRHHCVSAQVITPHDIWSIYDIDLSRAGIQSDWGLDMGVATRHAAASSDEVLPDTDEPTTQRPKNIYISRDARRYGVSIALEPEQKAILMSLGRRV